ncbi:MAG: hypothetical protein PWQ09_1515 [Candidatus Cloacimonadota bacterium]|jgi:hypothetical protein|nr:hypothetical protein [Candidatus Cloacimonadota bacterium]
MNILAYLLYYLIGNRSKVNLRKEKMTNLEINVKILLDEIEEFSNSMNNEITQEERNVLMKYIIDFCVISKRSKPDINKLKFKSYNEFIKFEKEYYKNKPRVEQFVDIDSFKKELDRWSNSKPEMNYKEELQYNKYSREISKWKSNLNEINVSDKAYFKLSKNERVLFDEIIETILKFPKLKDKILDLTVFLIEERDYYL